MAPTFQLSNVTDSSTNDSIPTPLFGLQDVLQLNYSTPDKFFETPSLFPNACQQEDGKRNCTASCLNTTQTFASLDTLHNCAVWPSIYAADDKNGLLPLAASLTRSLGLENGSDGSSLPSRISTNIQTCLLDSCDADDKCGSKANNTFPSGSFRQHFSIPLTADLYYGMNDSLPYFDPCRYINSPVTADVAGIGVFISYAMQMGLALIAFVLSIPWKRTAHSIRNVSLALWHKLRSEEDAPSKSNYLRVTKPTQNRSDEKDIKHAMKFDPASAIVPAVVEFQKAQCSFMLATNIAGLVVQKNGGLSPVSLQQLYNTYVFIKVIAIGGYLPITFGLITLRMLHKISWYLLALSVASVGVAIGDLYSERIFYPSPEDLTYLQRKSVIGGPTSCGGNNPVAWCYSRIGVNQYGFRTTNEGDGANDILTFSLVMIVLLMLEHFWNSTDHTNRKIRNFVFGSCIRRSIHDPSRRPEKILRWIWKFVVPLLVGIFVLIYLYCFAVFADDLNWFRVNEIYDSSWGFGQIVAILVWALPVIEYFWAMFRGIEDGADHRLPDGYEVRKKVSEEHRGSEVNESSAIVCKGA